MQPLFNGGARVAAHRFPNSVESQHIRERNVGRIVRFVTGAPEERNVSLITEEVLDSAIMASERTRGGHVTTEADIRQSKSSRDDREGPAGKVVEARRFEIERLFLR